MIIRNKATVSHDIDTIFAVSLIFYSHVFYKEVCILLISSFHLHLEAILPRLGHGGPEGEYKHCCTLSLTSALEEGGSSTPHAIRIIPGKETGHPTYRMLCGPRSRSGRLRNNSPTSGIHSTCRLAHSESLYRQH